MRIQTSPKDKEILNRYVLLGVEHPEVGYEDTQMPLLRMKGVMKRWHEFEISILESMLWSCVLMDELGQWGEAESLDDFIARLSPPNHKFNRDYCLFEKVI